MRYNKLLSLLAVAALLVSVSACGKDKAKFDANKVSCAAVAHDLSNAISAFGEAQVKAKNKAGERGEDKAKKAEAEAQAKADALSARQNACNKGAAPSPSPTTTVGDVVVNPKSLAEGFEDPKDVDPVKELAFGKEAAKLMKAATQERGRNAHSKKTLETVEELTGWLNNAKNKKAIPVKERVVKAITAVCGEKDVPVHLTQNKGWLLLVVKPKSQIKGTSYMTESGLYIANNWRQVGENDAYWLPVCTQGEHKGDVAWDGAVRADCGNAHEKPKIRINRPDTPPVPPVENVCPHAGDVPNSNGLCPKHPEDDVNVNPEVPDQVKGPGTTPVGTDPGPAGTEYDTPTGCQADCSPSPTPTKSPSPSPSSTPTQPPATTPVSSDPPATGKPTPPPSD